MATKKIPDERLLEFQNTISVFAIRSPEKKQIIAEFADLYGVSPNTVYRCLRERRRPKALHRSDAGIPRTISKADMERYCQLIVAMKVRTKNKKGRHLSTAECIRLLEDYGIHTPEGLMKAPKALLKKSTVNRYLKKWGYTLNALSIEPIAVRFQAKYANECWHFDLSPSDLKKLDEWPEWIEPKQGRPLLMLYSIVDDRSGVAYDEYHVVYGEDVESALRFLYRAMAPKEIEGFPFQGIPKMVYMDNGPISRSQVFRRVMDYLGVDVRVHMPRGKDGRRTTARAKGKVERPFRTVKEVHETLYHFHKPQNIKEANEWLLNYILRYNEKEHRSEPHSRIEDWVKNLPPDGFRKMCSWERFCTFAREPQHRKVGPDARITVDGVAYEVDSGLASEEVIIWWGLFDRELYVELGDRKFGPYTPVAGPIPLHRFRSFKKTRAERRADQVEQLAQQIQLPVAALTDDARQSVSDLQALSEKIACSAFQDPDPFHEISFPNVIAAKRAISSELGFPLAKLTAEDMQFIDQVLAGTLKRTDVLSLVKAYFQKQAETQAQAQGVLS